MMIVIVIFPGIGIDLTKVLIIVSAAAIAAIFEHKEKKDAKGQKHENIAGEHGHPPLIDPEPGLPGDFANG